jgi:hypothetical protein
MSLSNVLEEIKKVKPYVDEDVEAGPLETMAGRRGRKNQAIERMKTLKREYKDQLLQSAAFIIVTGEKSKEFTSSAVGNFQCFSADPNAFYKDLADRIAPTAYQGKESLSNLFDILGRHLEDKANELGIIGYPQLIFKQHYRITVKTKEDLVNLIRLSINEQVGSEIVGIQSTALLTNVAISKEHGAKVTPIILSTDDDTFALDLHKTLYRLRPRGVFVVVAGKGTKTLRAVDGVMSVKDASNENVEKVLTTISNSIKNR